MSMKRRKRTASEVGLITPPVGLNVFVINSMARDVPMIETFKGLPEDEIAAMLGGNAAEFYGFDTEKLAPIVARIGPEKSAFL